MPFRGDRAAAARLASAFAELELGDDDELILADNGARPLLARALAASPLARRAQIVRADGERSSYHARNAGAALARGEWILFCDADCEPAPRLIEAYLGVIPRADCGLLAGTIAAPHERRRLLVRYAVSRHFYCSEHGLQRERSYAPTGNLMVRRAAFEAVGGFTEGIRSAGDVDLCWRLQGAGWRLERRPEARVVHRHREELRSFLAMLARYGAGAAWLNRRYPGSSQRWALSGRELARAGADALRHAVRGEPDEARFRVIDALGLLAHNVGYVASNEVR